MKYIFLFLVLSLSLVTFSQTIQKQLRFNETFDNNNKGWPINNNGYSTGFSTDGRFVCTLPINNSMNWDWTWVPIPRELTRNLDAEESAELEFDWIVLDNTANFTFGLMFDTHNITNTCPGGDFREIYINGSNENITTRFVQMKDCKWDTEKQILGKTISNNGFSAAKKLKIIKEKYSWSIWINDENVLSFEYKGNLNMDKLNFGRGSFAFDNFKVYSHTLQLQTQEITSAAISEKPKIWIVLAGIEKYLYQKKLDYTVDDIAAMYNFWTSPSGGKIPKSQIVYLPDNYASTNSILSNANDLFSKASENDVIITFLSGHGGVGTFATYDGSMQYEYLNKILMQSKAKKKICFVDACHSGSFNSKDVRTDNGGTLDEAQTLNLFYEALNKSGGGVTYLLACKADQTSIENGDLKHGLFTYYILQGLTGAADSDKNHLVTIQELYDYIKPKIFSYNNEQIPIIKGTYDPDTPIAVY